MKPIDFLSHQQTRTKINLGSWQENAIRQLSGSETPMLESLVLLALVLEKPREWVISHSTDDLTDNQKNRLDQLLERLVKGEPLAYLTGKKAFYGMDFCVTKDVLIPRPETELLVEEAIQWLTDHPTRSKVADIGTGSGAIAIVLADAIPGLMVTAVDISPSALEIARANCETYHHEDQITFIQNDLLAGITLKFDLIAANLPYIPSPTLNTLSELRYEPQSALDGGEDGTKFIARLLRQSVDLLRPGGMILLEIEATISENVISLAKQYFPDAIIDVIFDYANFPRIIKIYS
jgi:release factor glutamine methyltransferase